MKFRSYKPTKKPKYKKNLLLIIALVIIILLWKNANAIAEMFFGN